MRGRMIPGGGAQTRLGLVLEGSLMLLDNACGNRQSQAGAVIFGGKERVEKAFFRLPAGCLYRCR